MNKPILFISHSTSRRPKTDRCVKIKECLHSLLSDSGWHVFTDEQRINPGNKWRTEILHNLQHAQAGIILFNKEATSNSDWVKAEAFHLCFRKSIDPNFQIVPVLLEDQNIGDTCFKEYEPFQLNEIQAIKDYLDPDPDKQVTPRDFAHKIAACFDSGKAGPPRMNKWVHRGVFLLKNVDVEVLKCAAEKLGMEENCYDIQHRHVVELMHHNPPLRNIEAFSELLTDLDSEKTGLLCKYLKAKWVENEAAQILINASRKPDEIGLLTINTNEIKYTEQYLNRAKIEIGNIKTISVSAAAGEGGGAKLHEIEKTISENFDIEKHDITEPFSQAILERLASNPNKKVICALPSEYAKERILKELRQRYPMIIFLVQVGSQAEHMTRFNYLCGKPLNPPLNDDKCKELTNLTDDLLDAMDAHFKGG